MKKITVPTQNKDVVCSWIYAWAEQRDMSLHEYRVILRAIEIVSAQMSGKNLTNYLYAVTPTLHTYEITLPVKEAFFSDLNNEAIRKELNNLLRRTFSVENKEKKIWWACSFIEHPEVNEGEGTISFGIYKPFAKILLDFTQGFRKFELNKALALPSTYAMRFYLLMSGGGDPIDMDIPTFRKWLGIEDTDYIDRKTGKQRTDNMEQRIIKPSQKALDETCPWTFSYEKIKKTNHPRSEVTGFRFYPTERRANRDEALERASKLSKLTTKNAIGDYLNVWLRGELGWPQKSVNSHKKNIDEAFRVLGQEKTIKIMKELVDRWNKLHELDPDQYPSQIRYVMGTLKKQVKEADPKAFSRQEKKTKYLDDIPY